MTSKQDGVSEAQLVSAQVEPKDDPISAELERALFRRFWLWLGVVGSIVLVVVSGFSIIASSVAATAVDTRYKDALKNIENLEARYRDKLDYLEQRYRENQDRMELRAQDSALKINTAQVQSEVAATSMQQTVTKAQDTVARAQDTVVSLTKKIETVSQLADALKGTDKIAGELATNKEFVDRISSVSIQSLQKLADWSPNQIPAERAATNGGYGPVTGTCPKGTYAVGVTAWGNSAGSYCIGCLIAVQLICRKLNIDASLQ
jgi:hypothetical protein